MDDLYLYTMKIDVFVKEILPNKQSLLEENIVLQFWKGDFDRIMQTTKNGGYFF